MKLFALFFFSVSLKKEVVKTAFFDCVEDALEYAKLQGGNARVVEVGDASKTS